LWAEGNGFDMERLSILLVEDHPLFRRGMRTLIASVPEFELVGEADDGDTAVTMAIEHQPDVVLMDLQLPGRSGIGATRAITATLPTIKVLVVTLFKDDDSVFAALRAGARGYILKDADEAEMVRAIRSVAAGEAHFGPAVAGLVLAFFAEVRPRAPQVFPVLTERERDILHLVARGGGNMAIANELGLSSKTVANNVSAIIGKLQVADRAEAIARARAAGLG
jgi:DNA-binding NarL/FixJ family response regulator